MRRRIPRAAHETELVYRPTARRQRIAVVGAGPAGLSAATVAAQRGHEVHLFDSADRIGGQFNWAQRVPGKEEFAQTLRYFNRLIATTGVQLHLGQRVTREALQAQGFDAVVVATGIVPRRPPIPGIDHPKVLALATELDCAEAEAGWLVVRLWAWTMRYAARGRLADGPRRLHDNLC